ncbi:MAG: hypothetical protein QOH72_2375 [Solirubrobacteraceae bacterium]|jgi:hypothetical protein|nr:hypothetical protein [Solirubrobacteraceae bacterium]
MLRLRAVATGAALLALLCAAPAFAHQGNPNYRSVIHGLTPAVPGVKLQVLNFDDRLQLDNRTGKTIVVQGYQKEPYARLLADGTVEVNHNSPAFYLNDDRFAQSKVPATAKPTATPAWQVVDRTGTFQWHDHRIHWMSTVAPKQVTDKSKRTKVFDWNVPLQVGRQKASVTGSLFWQPKPGGGIPTGALAALVALAVLGLGVVFVVRRRRGELDGRATSGEAQPEAW